MSSNDAPLRHPVVPHLVCHEAADAIEFYKKAFGAEEVMRLPGSNGRLMHAGLLINGASVLLVDENKDYGLISPKTLGGSPVTITLEVADVDATVARAVAAGATIKMEVSDQFWGDRYGTIEDPFGHSWAILTPLKKEPPTEAELVAAAQSSMS